MNQVEVLNSFESILCILIYRSVVELYCISLTQQCNRTLLNGNRTTASPHLHNSVIGLLNSNRTLLNSNRTLLPLLIMHTGVFKLEVNFITQTKTI